MLLNSTNMNSPEYHIAFNLLQCLSEIPSLRIEEVAKRCFTSSATLSRFCTKLGYSNYTVFRKAVQHEMEDIEKQERNQAKILSLPTNIALPSVLDSMLIALRAFRASLNTKQIMNAAKEIADSPQCVIMGPDIVQPAILDFQIKMYMAGKNITFQKSIPIDSIEESGQILDKDTLLIYLFPVNRLLSTNLELVRTTSALFKMPCRKLLVTASQEVEIFLPDANIISLPTVPNQFNEQSTSLLSLQCALEMVYVAFRHLLAQRAQDAFRSEKDRTGEDN